MHWVRRHCQPEQKHQKTSRQKAMGEMPSRGYWGRGVLIDGRRKRDFPREGQNCGEAHLIRSAEWLETRTIRRRVLKEFPNVNKDKNKEKIIKFLSFHLNCFRQELLEDSHVPCFETWTKAKHAPSLPPPN